MNDQTNTGVQDMLDILSDTWQGLVITAGLTAGLYDELSMDNPVSMDELARKMNFDESKLDKWFYFMEGIGLVKRANGMFTLTEKGNLFSRNSPFKDLVGMFHLNEFYMQASLQSRETFRKGMSLDKLSEGKISRDYQPRVSDNFSFTVIDNIKQHNITKTDTLFDAGCGKGSFLKNVAILIPDIKLTGMDFNLFAIER